MCKKNNQFRTEDGTRCKGYFKKSPSGKPLISVITVVLNGSKYLEETILSVINQTYDNVEYMIIDGGSVDGTVDIIKKYENDIAYWISKCDQGIYDAMNKGINLATGEWICFMNGGDRFYNNQTIEDVFLDCPDNVDLIYGDCEIRYLNYGESFSRIQRAGDIKNLWKGMVFNHQSLFVKTTLMKQNTFNIFNQIGADFEFIYKAFMNNNRFYNTKKVISSISSQGLSDTHRIRCIRSHRQVVKKYSKGLQIDVYYVLISIDLLIRAMLKKVLPEKLVKLIIKNKS